MTWKLFEMLLCKRHSHVAHNLVLRNLASHAHVSLPSAVHDSPTAGTNCVDDTDVTLHADEVTGSNHVSSPFSLSAPQKLSAENCDTLAHGDSGVSTNDIHSLSPPLSDAVLDSSKVDGVASLSREGESSLSHAETDKTGVMDTAAGGDVGVHSHVLSKSHSAFETQTAASLLRIHAVSQTSVESSEIPIQQVVYT